jgi:catalase
MSFPADGDPKKFQPKRSKQAIDVSPALSMVDNPNFPKNGVSTRKIAFLVADGFDTVDVMEMKKALLTAGAKVMTVAPRLGILTGAHGEILNADCSLLTGASVLFDGVYVPGGEQSVEALKLEKEAIAFIDETYKHCKTIGANGAGVELLAKAGLTAGTIHDDQALESDDRGIILGRDGDIAGLAVQYIDALAQHRHWQREPLFEAGVSVSLHEKANSRR